MLDEKKESIWVVLRVRKEDGKSIVRCTDKFCIVRDGEERSFLFDSLITP